MEVEDPLREPLVGVGRRVEEDQRQRRGDQADREEGHAGGAVVDDRPKHRGHRSPRPSGLGDDVLERRPGEQREDGVVEHEEPEVPGAGARTRPDTADDHGNRERQEEERQQQLAGTAGDGHRADEGPDGGDADVRQRHRGDRARADAREEDAERGQGDGGGMGIIYRRALESGSGKWWHDYGGEPSAFSIGDYADAIVPPLRDLGIRILVEPGRFLVGNSGVLLTRVRYIKKSGAKTFAIVDAGMNDLIRPALYQQLSRDCAL